MATLLAYPDPNKVSKGAKIRNRYNQVPHLTQPYTLYTDASNSCIVACLTKTCEDEENSLLIVKNEKPIYYLSPKLSKTQCKWLTMKNEAYAINYSLQKLDIYLNGARFAI